MSAEHGPSTHRVVVYRPDWTVKRRVGVHADVLAPEQMRVALAAANPGCDVEIELVEPSPIADTLREVA